MKTELNIAVTGLNATDNPGPGVPVIRSLKEAKSFGCRIIGLSYDTLEPGVYMHDLVACTYRVPYPAAGPEALLERITEINKKEHIDIIIPNFDAELYSYIKIEPQLKELGIKMFVPTLAQLEERQKYNLHNFGRKYDITIPETKIHNSFDDLAKTSMTYPCVIKGKYYEAYISKTRDEALSNCLKVAAKWGYPVISQEFLTGTEYNVIGCGDGKGNTIAAVPMRKQYITDKGKAWAGISIINEEMLNLCQKFVKATQWRGGFELELLQTQDKKLYLIEINPRLPAWVYLATGAGQNIPEQIVHLALGETPANYSTYEVGKMFVRCSWDLIIDQEEYINFTINGQNP